MELTAATWPQLGCTTQSRWSARSMVHGTLEPAAAPAAVTPAAAAARCPVTRGVKPGRGWVGAPSWWNLKMPKKKGDEAEGWGWGSLFSWQGGSSRRMPS